MTELLLKIFIKNSNDTDNPVVRQKYGMLSGIVGITCNIILFLLKFLAGIITGAVSVAADAFNNLSDAGSSIVTFIGFKVSGKPADTEHPFGHGRIEYIPFHDARFLTELTSNFLDHLVSCFRY